MRDAPQPAETLVFPIGQLGGGYRRDVESVWQFSVRRGRDLVTLSGQQYLMWLSAHGSSARVAEIIWTPASVVALARQSGLTDPERTYAEMRDLQLIVEVEPDGVVEFAAAHQLVPLTYSLGNTAEQPDWFGLGFPPKPWVSVPRLMWLLWRDGHLEHSLWDACEALCRREGLADPRRLLRDALDRMHMLLSIQTVYLDVLRFSESEDGQ